MYAVTANAQTVVVTGDGSTFTNAGASNAADPACALAADTWCARNVRNNGVVGITSTYARSGNGSIEFSGPDAMSYKSDFEYYLSTPNQFTLFELSSFGYDWYRSSTSAAPAHFAPAIRLIMSDGSYLVYEPTLDGTPKNTIFNQPTDSWQTSSIGDNNYLWWTAEGTQVAYSLGDWKSGRTAGNGRTLNGNAVVIGFSTGIGSGWTGSFFGAVDNVNYRTSNVNVATTFNFEVEGATAVPEPTTTMLLSVGMVALGVASRRRRRGQVAA